MKSKKLANQKVHNGHSEWHPNAPLHPGEEKPQKQPAGTPSAGIEKPTAPITESDDRPEHRWRSDESKETD